jgi:hypothetical protein
MLLLLMILMLLPFRLYSHLIITKRQSLAVTRFVKTFQMFWVARRLLINISSFLYIIKVFWNGILLWMIFLAVPRPVLWINITYLFRLDSSSVEDSSESKTGLIFFFLDFFVFAFVTLLDLDRFVLRNGASLSVAGTHPLQEQR